MRLRHGVALVSVLSAVLLRPIGATAVMVGQIDTFEDGTTQNWIVALLGASHPAPPVNVPSGGPGGLDDNYLRLTALGGGGPGSRLAVINVTQWAGNYPAAGVTAIRMDVNNLGSTELALRLFFADPQAGPPSNIAVSTDAVAVPAGSGWVSVTFPIRLADLTATQGTASDALANATDVRLFHNSSAAFPPDSVVANLGVDNIRALGVVPVPALLPWPTTMLGILLCGAGVLVLRRAGQPRR